MCPVLQGGKEKERERDDGAGLGAVEPAASALRRLLQEIETSRPASIS